jgi:hypothetical protein
MWWAYTRGGDLYSGGLYSEVYGKSLNVQILKVQSKTMSMLDP